MTKQYIRRVVRINPICLHGDRTKRTIFGQKMSQAKKKYTLRRGWTGRILQLCPKQKNVFYLGEEEKYLFRINVFFINCTYTHIYWNNTHTNTHNLSLTHTHTHTHSHRHTHKTRAHSDGMVVYYAVSPVSVNTSLQTRAGCLSSVWSVWNPPLCAALIVLFGVDYLEGEGACQGELGYINKSKNTFLNKKLYEMVTHIFTRFKPLKNILHIIKNQ